VLKIIRSSAGAEKTVRQPNLTQNSDSRSFKVTCFGVSGNWKGDKALSNTVRDGRGSLFLDPTRPDPRFGADE